MVNYKVNFEARPANILLGNVNNLWPDNNVII